MVRGRIETLIWNMLGFFCACAHKLLYFPGLLHIALHVAQIQCSAAWTVWFAGGLKPWFEICLDFLYMCPYIVVFSWFTTYCFTCSADSMLRGLNRMVRGRIEALIGNMFGLFSLHVCPWFAIHHYWCFVRLLSIWLVSLCFSSYLDKAWGPYGP